LVIPALFCAGGSATQRQVRERRASSSTRLHLAQSSTHNIVVSVLDGADQQHGAEWDDRRQRIQRRDFGHQLQRDVIDDVIGGDVQRR